MIYVTGDCHGEFRRFHKKQRMRSGLGNLTEKDYLIICGDFGLLWLKDAEFKYNLDWMSRLPFTILWVQGNHENYNMIAEYPIEFWNGGKVRHILRDKIILLERGQVFTIEGKKFFTFGGAQSHDIEGGILDRTSPTFEADRIYAKKKGLSCRILNESWWKAELPTDEEMNEGIANLEANNWKVDYVITHCTASSIEVYIGYTQGKYFQGDVLTRYFEYIDDKLDFKHWYFGHYHIDKVLDKYHTVVYNSIVALDDYKNYEEIFK